MRSRLSNMYQKRKQTKMIQAVDINTLKSWLLQTILDNNYLINFK